MSEVIHALGQEEAVKQLREIGKIKDPIERLRLCRDFADVSRSPARMIPNLANKLRQLGAPEAGCKLLLRGQSQFSGDFWINLALTRSYDQFLSPDQILRFGYAALASRPESTTCRHNVFMICCPQLLWNDAAQINTWFLDRSKTDYYRTGFHAYVLEHAGRFAEAEVWYGRLLKFEPTNPDSLAAMGILLRKMGREKEAEDFIKGSRSLDPEYETGSLVVGSELEEKGIFTRAF